jgi:hypothetical protein
MAGDDVTTLGAGGLPAASPGDRFKELPKHIPGYFPNYQSALLGA